MSKNNRRKLVNEMMSRDVKQSGEPVESARPEGGRSNNESDVVAALAYELWQERGCPVGSDQEDWFRAEAQLESQRCSTVTAA